MDDANFFKWLFGTFLVIWVFITKWTHTRASSAHEKINKVSDKLGLCRQEIDREFSSHMTEFQIKDFVDRSIKPLENKVDAIHVDLKTLLARDNK